MWCYAAGLFQGHERTAERIGRLVEMSLEMDESQFVAPRIEFVPTAAKYLGEMKVTTVGPQSPSSHLIRVTDPAAETLGRFPGDGSTVLAEKELGDWRSIYTLTASLPSELYRGLARAAGAHIYNDRNDTLYVNHHYLTINADGTGERVLRLPLPCDVYDAISETLVAGSVRELQVDLRDKETRIFRLQPTGSGQCHPSLPETSSEHSETLSCWASRNGTGSLPRTSIHGKVDHCAT